MMRKNGLPVRILLLVILLLASLACTCNLLNLIPQVRPTSESSTDGGEEMSVDPLDYLPELSSISELATVMPDSITIPVGPKAGVVELGEGSSIKIPMGAFPTSNQLQVARVDIAFDQIAPDVRAGKFYVFLTQYDVPVLGAPIILEIPRTSPDVTVIRYDGGNWVPIHVEPGQIIQVSIDHFSKGIFGVVEWASEIVNTTVDDPSAQRMRAAIEGGDQNAHSFFGVNENAIQTETEMCADILSILKQYNTSKNRAFPATEGSTIGLADFLFSGSAPSQVGGPYWELTRNTMGVIGEKLLATEDPISPAEFLKIAIEANNGNIPLGVLAAHNYLKDITYRGRIAYNPSSGMPAEFGEPTRHLRSWRQGNNITAAGEYDKMGPIYHIFAAMTGGLWLPTRASGPVIAAGEAFLRTFRIGADRPDTPKAAADQCGIDAASWLRNHSPEELPVEVTGTLVPVGLNPGVEVLTNTITITFKDDGSGEVTGNAKYGGRYLWEECGLLLPLYTRWELTGTYDPATRKISGTAQVYGSGQIAYTDCSVGDVGEYASGEGGTWEATLENGVVSGSITLIQVGGTPLLQVTFTAQ